MTNQKASFTILSAEAKIARAREWLLRNKPMWGSLLYRLAIREDTKGRTRTMITDGRVIAWCRGFVDTLSVEETTAVLAHEVGHCMLKHVFRQGGRDPKAWEEAADHVVNLLLVEDKFDLPSCARHLDGSFVGMSAEQVYPIVLARHQAEQQEQQEQQDQDQPQSDEGEQEQKSQGGAGGDEGEQDESSSMGEMAEPGTLGDPSEPQPDAEDDPEEGDEGEPNAKGEGEEESEGEKEGEGEGGESPDDAAEEGQENEHQSKQPGEAPSEPQPLSEAEQRALEADWGQAAAAAAQQAVQRGHGSRNEQRLILQSNVQPISFDEYCDHFLQKIKDRSRETWRRQSRRSIASDIYLPGRRGERTGALVMVIDTSGSINQQALTKFVSNGQKAQDDLKPSSVIVLYADDEVMNEVRYEYGERFEVNRGDIRGGGGTDFRPAFKRVMEIQEQEGLEVAGVLYLTDLEGDFPKAEDARGYPPTLWCFDSSSCMNRNERECLMREVSFGEIAELQL